MLVHYNVLEPINDNWSSDTTKSSHKTNISVEINNAVQKITVDIVNNRIPQRLVDTILCHR